MKHLVKCGINRNIKGSETLKKFHDRLVEELAMEDFGKVVHRLAGNNQNVSYSDRFNNSLVKTSFVSRYDAFF